MTDDNLILGKNEEPSSSDETDTAPTQSEQAAELPKTGKPRKRIPSNVAFVLIVALMFLAPIGFFLLYEPPAREDTVVDIYTVSELRELAVLEEVPYYNMTQDELEDEMASIMDYDEMNRTAMVLHSLFLIDEKSDFTGAFSAALAEQVLGYYDSEKKEMVLIDSGYSEALTKITLAHELAHALQDQHFGLTDFMRPAGWDEYAAREALVEGDASLVMMQYMLGLSAAEQLALAGELLGADMSNMTDMLDMANATDIPYAIEKLLAFSYLEGMLFTSQLYDEGGWEAINSAYASPPVSSEQIMHPDKYLAGEMPEAVWTGISMPGMELSVNETLGEYMISTMLGHYIAPSDAEIAAEGWGGDNFMYFGNESAFLSVWEIEWDTPQDANEFRMIFDDWSLYLPTEDAAAFADGRAVIVQTGHSTTIYHASNPQLVADAMAYAP